MNTCDLDLGDLRKRIDEGLGEVQRGEGSDGENFMRALIEDLDGHKARANVGNSREACPNRREGNLARRLESDREPA